MKNLFLSEWKRLWSRKTTMLCLLAIPIIVLASAKYYLSVNNRVMITDPKFTSFYNFPVAALQEQLLIAFNSILLLFVVLSVTDEFTNGTIRMVLIRPIKIVNVFWAKFLVILSTMFILLLGYLCISYIVGYLLFPKVSKIAVFYWDKTLIPKEMFLYTLKYYSLAFLTIVAMAALMFFIAIVSKSITISLGTTVGLLLVLASYPMVIQIFFRGDYTRLILVKLLSLIEMQFAGIAIMLGQRSFLFSCNLLIIASYIVIFTLFNYFIYKKRDNLM